MDFQENTGKSIQEAFELYDSANPSVYEHFKKLAFELIRAGKKKISFKLILNRIRWDVYVQTEEPTLFNQKGEKVKFKINDAYSSRYARKFVSDFPEHENIVELRNLRA